MVVRGDVQKHLRCLSRAAESIAVGDTVDAVVRRGQKWNMLPTQVSWPSFLFLTKYEVVTIHLFDEDMERGCAKRLPST